MRSQRAGNLWNWPVAVLRREEESSWSRTESYLRCPPYCFSFSTSTLAFDSSQGNKPGLQSTFVYFGLRLLFLPRATLTFKGKVLATYCIESVCRKVLVAGGATGVVSVRSCQKLSLCLMDSRAADCKVDPPLVKVKPISNGSSAYGITDVRRGKSPLTADREKSENMWEKDLQRWHLV